MTELTQEQIDAVEGMLARRMEHMGETRAEASAFILKFLKDRIANPSEEGGCACCGMPL